jgi:hypothetical protein
MVNCNEENELKSEEKGPFPSFFNNGHLGKTKLALSPCPTPVSVF